MRLPHHHHRLLLGLFRMCFVLIHLFYFFISFFHSSLLFFLYFLWLHYSATHSLTVYFRISAVFCGHKHLLKRHHFFTGIFIKTKSAPCGQSHGLALEPQRLYSFDDDNEFPTLQQLAVPGVSEWWVCPEMDYWPFTFNTYFSYWSRDLYQLLSHVCFPFSQVPRP